MSSKGHEYRCSRCRRWFPEPEIDKHACIPGDCDAMKHPGDMPADWDTNVPWLLGELCYRLSRRIVNEHHGPECVGCGADKNLITTVQKLLLGTPKASK